MAGLLDNREVQQSIQKLKDEFPQTKQIYYYITGTFGVGSDMWLGTPIDRRRKETNNVFDNAQTAQTFANKIIKFLEEHNGKSV